MNFARVVITVLCCIFVTTIAAVSQARADGPIRSEDAQMGQHVTIAMGSVKSFIATITSPKAPLSDIAVVLSGKGVEHTFERIEVFDSGVFMRAYVVDEEVYAGPGDYTVTIAASDGEGGSSVLHVLKLTVSSEMDATAPIVRITSPINEMTYRNVSALSYGVSDDQVVGSCRYSTDGGQTVSEWRYCSGVFSGILDGSDGENTWTVYARDNSGNIGESSVTFNIDSSISLEVSGRWSGM